MSGHAAPTHNSALDEACDFVSERYGATMLHVTALFRADAAIQSKGEKMSGEYFSENALSSFGMDIHAGVGETSGMLAIRPDLVRSNYKTLPNRAGRSPDELRQVALARDWEGYFSSPAQATAAYGRAVEEWWISGLTELILRAVRGENLFASCARPADDPSAGGPDSGEGTRRRRGIRGGTRKMADGARKASGAGTSVVIEHRRLLPQQPQIRVQLPAMMPVLVVGEHEELPSR
jgi:hypothetical protein